MNQQLLVLSPIHVLVKGHTIYSPWLPWLHSSSYCFLRQHWLANSLSFLLSGGWSEFPLMYQQLLLTLWWVANGTSKKSHLPCILEKPEFIVRIVSNEQRLFPKRSSYWESEYYKIVVVGLGKVGFNLGTLSASCICYLRSIIHKAYTTQLFSPWSVRMK